MKEILQDLIITLEQGRNPVFCGIVESSGLAPRTSGERMLVLPDGSIWGSGGGGAVEGACMAVIVHGGVNRVLLCRVLGMPLENLFRLEQDYACVNILHVDERGYRVGAISMVIRNTR